MDFIRRFAVVGFGIVSFWACRADAQLNSWTNPASANWESNYWSLGLLPGANQSVFITNSGYKAVGVFSSTVSGYPGSLTVSNLTIAAPGNALSTVLLNYVGTGVPLRILNGCEVDTNGSLINELLGIEDRGPKWRPIQHPRRHGHGRRRILKRIQRHTRERRKTATDERHREFFAGLRRVWRRHDEPGDTGRRDGERHIPDLWRRVPVNRRHSDGRGDRRLLGRRANDSDTEAPIPAR